MSPAILWDRSGPARDRRGERCRAALSGHSVAKRGRPSFIDPTGVLGPRQNPGAFAGRPVVLSAFRRPVDAAWRPAGDEGGEGTKSCAVGLEISCPGGACPLSPLILSSGRVAGTIPNRCDLDHNRSHTLGSAPHSPPPIKVSSPPVRAGGF
jgi:hypothetical protein